MFSFWSKGNKGEMTYQTIKSNHPLALLPRPSFHHRPPISETNFGCPLSRVRMSSSTLGFPYTSGGSSTLGAPDRVEHLLHLRLGIYGGRPKAVHDADHTRLEVEDRRSEVFEDVR